MLRTAPFEKYTSRYEDWFERNSSVYGAELRALKASMPESAKGLEVGVGTGRFAAPLGIHFGVDPSPKMLKIAQKRGIEVVHGVGESIPFAASSFDVVLMITTLCFLDDARLAFREAKRVLKEGGHFVIGFIDKNSSLGRLYQEKKGKNPFYKLATFYSVDEVLSLLESSDFVESALFQTISGSLEDIRDDEPVLSGSGEGSFVVIRAMKPFES